MMLDDIRLIQKRPYYNQFSWAYDLLDSKPVDSICNFIDKSIKDYNFPPDSKLLDAGCGTGSYAVKLAEKGYDVTGIDVSPEQISQANQKVMTKKLSVKFICADFVNNSLDNCYDVILCRGVLNDYIDDIIRQDVFSRFSSLLPGKGLLIFDVRDWENTMIRKEKIPVTEKTIESKQGKLHFKSVTELDKKNHTMLITETHRLVKNKKESVVVYNFKMRCWTLPEIEENLSRAGFDILSVFGGYDNKIKLEGSEKIIITAVLPKK